MLKGVVEGILMYSSGNLYMEIKFGDLSVLAKEEYKKYYKYLGSNWKEHKF